MRPILLSVLLVVLTASDAAAVRWSAITSLDGLPSNDVLDLAEGADGAIWAATSGGLARFARREPGATWQSIDPRGFLRVAVDLDGIVWAADGDANLHRFDAQGGRLEVLANTAPNVVVEDLEPASDGGVYVARNDVNSAFRSVLLHTRVVGGVAVRDTVRSGVRVFAARAGFDGSVWWGRDERTVERSRGDAVDAFILPTTSSESEVIAVAPLSLGGVVAATSSGEVYYVADDGMVDEVEVGRTGSVVLDDAIEDARGRILVARQDEVVIIGRQGSSDPAAWTHQVITNRNGLVGGRVVDMLETRFGELDGGATGSGRELWFATDVGIAIQSDLPWSTFRCADGGLAPAICTGASEVVNVVSTGPDGSVWFGTSTGLSVLRSDGSTEGFVGRLAGGDLVVPEVRDLILDDDGAVYVATAVASQTSLVLGGLQRYRDGQWTTLGEGSPEWFVWSMERDATGRLWLATEAGLFWLDTSVEPAALVAQDATVGLPWTAVTAVATRGDEIVVGADEGLARLPSGSSSWVLLPIDGLEMTPCRDDGSERIASIAIGTNSIAAAVSGGLLLVDDDATSLADAVLLGPPFLSECTIFDIEVESDGSWLLATNSGLARVLADLSRVGPIGPVDGLPSTQAFAIHRRNDEVYFGFPGDGAAVHRFENPETAIVRPLPAVLANANTPLPLEVAAFDPDNLPERVRFEIRVGDSDWVGAGSGPALTFAPSNFGLGQGSHTVEVRAIDPGALVDLSPATTTFELDVEPPAPVITRPAAESAVSGWLDIEGSATDLRFSRYRVDVEREGQSIPITDWSSEPVSDGQLGRIDTTLLEDDRWTVRVTVQDTLGVVGTSQARVLVDNEAPFAAVTSPVDLEGARGGTVASIDGAAILDVPALAFRGRATMTIDEVEAEDPTFDVAGFDGPLDYPATLRLRIPEGFGEKSIVRLGTATEVLGGTLEERRGVRYLAVSVERLGRFSVGDGRPDDDSGAAILADFDVQPRYVDPRSAAADGDVSISFTLGRRASVRAVVYSRNGRARRVIVDGERLDPGRHVLRWDGRDHQGVTLTTGLYVVHLEADGQSETQVIGVGRR